MQDRLSDQVLGDPGGRAGVERLWEATLICYRLRHSIPPVGSFRSIDRRSATGYYALWDGKVVEICAAAAGDRNRAVTDLGDVALLPKLVNAHTHLEFSDCSEPIGESGIRLSSWIRQVIAARGVGSRSEREQAIRRGMDESDRVGVGLIGDIATPPSSYSRQPAVVSFAEVLGLSDQRSAERVEASRAHQSDVGEWPNVEFGISPHAPYSTPPNLIQSAVDRAQEANIPVAMHVAESAEERDLLERGGGPFADSLREAGVWREGLFPYPGDEPLSQIIAQLARSPRALLVHGNDLRDGELEQIARHSNLTVVYCPRTHAFFRHPRHPVDQMLRMGIRVALGTDSRASNPDLNVWGEVQWLLRHRTDLDPLRVLEMGTRAGADALLGVGGRGHGRIRTGCDVNSVVAVKTTADRLDQVWRDFAVGDLLCIRSLQRA